MPHVVQSAILGDIELLYDLGKVLLLEAVNPLLSHSIFVGFTVGTITLGAKFNELILLVCLLRNSCG